MSSRPLSFRWPPEFVARIDRACGSVARSRWIRDVIEQELERFEHPESQPEEPDQ